MVCGTSFSQSVPMISNSSEVATSTSETGAVRMAHQRPHPDLTPLQATSAVLAAAGVGLLIGIALEADKNWVDQASPNAAEFEALGRGLISLAIGMPLAIVVTSLLFWRLPLRSRTAAGAFAPFAGFNLWQALFAFGVTSHTSHAGWPAIPLAFSFGLATWVFLPGRSTIVGVAAVLGVLVLLALAPKVQSLQMNSKREGQIASAGVPIATTTLPGYHLRSVWAQPGSDPTGTFGKINLTFTRDGNPSWQDDSSFRVQTYDRSPELNPPSNCGWVPSLAEDRSVKAVPCTKVATRIWWSADDRTVIAEYRSVVVRIASGGYKEIPEARLIDAARHLHPTTAHNLVHAARPS